MPCDVLQLTGFDPQHRDLGRSCMRTCGLPTFDTTHIIQHRPRRHQSSLRGIPLNGHLEIHRSRVMVVVLDRYNRPLRDLRISVTDRCNLRCTYCMPSEIFGPEFPFLPRSEILTFEEITAIVDVARSMGVRKVRITGGEPLLRRDLPHLIRMIRDLSPDLDLALTTNGVLLARQLDELQRAGLSRVTVSLDALDAGTFERITDAGTSVGTVLDGIDARVASGPGLPVKVNSVIRSGWNESEVLPLAARFKGTPVELIHRIHGCGNHQRMEDGSSHHWCDDENMVDGAWTTRTDWKDRGDGRGTAVVLGGWNGDDRLHRIHLESVLWELAPG